DKDDVLFLSLKLVLESYEKEIPLRLEGIEHPVERLCMAVRAYCMIVDRLRDATVLAYRSTKSLRSDRRALIKQDEIRTNRLLEACLQACIAGGFMRQVNAQLLVYQYVIFCHAWALKNWALKEKMSVSKYVDEGIKLLVAPFLTAKGKAALASVRLDTGNFKHEKKPARQAGKARVRG
ncbi:MAG: TetR/AcrR family transcriptional regulator, partial [Rhodocyclaceae bacterium]